MKQSKTTRSAKRERLTEVTRSFTRKIHLEKYDPRAKFESADFFCSNKVECYESEKRAVSREAYQFCKSEVLASVGEYIDLVRTAVADRAARQKANGERTVEPVEE